MCTLAGPIDVILSAPAIRTCRQASSELSSSVSLCLASQIAHARVQAQGLPWLDLVPCAGATILQGAKEKGLWKQGLFTLPPTMSICIKSTQVRLRLGFFLSA